MKNKGFHITKAMFFARENLVFDGLWGPWYYISVSLKNQQHQHSQHVLVFLHPLSSKIGTPS